MSTRRFSKYPAWPAADCREHLADLRRAMERVLSGGQFILGHEVAMFEREFAESLAAGWHAVAVASGTDAIELMLRALEIGHGDAVVVPDFAPSAVAAAVERAGCQVVLAEVEETTLTLCPQSLDRVLKSHHGQRVRAAIAVHLYGQPVDWAALAKVAEAHGIELLEDCAQAHGACWQGRQVGTLGRMAAFSFYPTKNLGALGDAGAVVTADADLAERLRQLRQYGWQQRHISSLRGGINSRMDELQAAILRTKLPKMKAKAARRQALAALYQELLPSTVRLPEVRSDCVHAWHQFVIRSGRRDALLDHLNACCIPAAVLYPAPLHEQGAWPHEGRFCISDKAAREVLALPLHPSLDRQAILRVAEVIHHFHHEPARA
ncbi:MAG: DegT/DnrJ/EryC1/StrS family aminotransferase [Prosthecobacter sp.]|nr:DegT/DnrJ/EryC1/StrS family aminotransferase [Prosthecobacter sp.]